MDDIIIFGLMLWAMIGWLTALWYADEYNDMRDQCEDKEDMVLFLYKELADRGVGIEVDIET